LLVEQDKNAGNIAETDTLANAYNEKLEAFEEVKKHVEILVQDAKKLSKEELSLSEKKKHLVAKQKKLKRTLTEVLLATHPSCISLLDS
jgi:structural maintenance of chromosome 4